MKDVTYALGDDDDDDEQKQDGNEKGEW
jgi:hypothetical protein